MITRRTLTASAAGLLAQLMMVQRSDGAVKDLFKADLPDLTLKDWSVTAVEVSYGPGESTPAHRHPGITIAYVLEGEIQSKVGSEPEKKYSVGQMFMETPGQLHAISRNASSSRPARLLAVMLTEKGKPLTTMEQ